MAGFSRRVTRRNRFAAIFTVCLSAVAGANVGHAVNFDEYPQAQLLVDEIVETHGLDRTWVSAIIADSQYKQEVIDAITRPAEKFPWHRYRKIFVKRENAEAGASFWRRHEEALERARREFGVNPEVIVAIIGVETRYGKVTGRHRVIDSLITLTLGYPRRSEFFRRELIEFVKLCSEEGLNPYNTKGSYAGAMGIPQFISSSYTHYAIDFDGDGKRDLLRQPTDAIGSVANYLKKHGWIPDAAVYVDFSTDDETQLDSRVTKQLDTDTTYASLRAAGAMAPEATIADDQPFGLVMLETSENSKVYRGAYPNFYVITKYNRSPLYASAVAELSELIADSYYGR